MASVPDTELKEVRRTRLLLALVLLAGLAVRVWMALDHPRFFDDHYVINNIAPFLDGAPTPRHLYYGTLSFLPQAVALAGVERLHAWTGIEALAVRGPQIEGFTLGAYRLMRMFVVAYGVLSLLAVYRVGRRLYSPRAGLLAAAVLAAYPQHVRSSIQLKPDMLVLLLILVTLDWTVRALREPYLSRFLRVGVGVGLATSAKYYGVVAALPLTAWAVVTGWRERRRWFWLPLAGLASLATFLVLNPFPAMVLHNGRGVIRLYTGRAREFGSGHWEVFRRELEFLAQQHGWVLGVFLLVGTALLAARLRRGSKDVSRSEALLPLTLYAGYTVLHAAGLTLFYPHNFMPVLAGTALVCAYGGMACWDRLARLLPPERAWWVLAGAFLLLGGFLLVRPIAYAYERLVPETWEAAGAALRARLADSQAVHLAIEPETAKLASPADGERTARTSVPSLARLPAEDLDLTDAEVFPLARLEGSPEAGFYQGRRKRLASECALEIRPEVFRHTGEPLLVLLHPWRTQGEPLELGLRRAEGGEGGLVAALPSGLAAGGVYSFELIRPVVGTTGAEHEVRLEPGGEALPLRIGWERRKRIRLLSYRFRLPAGVAEVRVPAAPKAFPASYRLQLWSWTEVPCRNGRDMTGVIRR